MKIEVQLYIIQANITQFLSIKNQARLIRKCFRLDKQQWLIQWEDIILENVRS